MIRANDSGHYAAARRRVSPFGVARCRRYANRNSPPPVLAEPARKLLRNLGVCVLLPFRAAYRCGQQSGKSQADRGGKRGKERWVRGLTSRGEQRRSACSSFRLVCAREITCATRDDAAVPR